MWLVFSGLSPVILKKNNMKKVAQITINSKSIVFPFVSVIIPTYNSIRTIGKCLKSVSNQNYPKSKMEVIIIDGYSTDKTLQVIKETKLKIKVINGKYPKDPEACKGEGLAMAKGEIVCLLDSDNYLLHKNWFRKMIVPLMKDKELVGSYPWRFAYRRYDKILNRYFSLIGAADPVALYLGKADKLSYVSDKWTLYGKVISDFKDYFVIQFDKEHFPTLGSSGFFARKKTLLKGKADIEHFFHIDVPFDLNKMGINKYAIVRDVVVHDTAEELKSFLRKRVKYMRIHYEGRAKDRRYKVFDPTKKEDLFRLFVAVIFAFTFIEPLFFSIRGYVRIQDRAWFVHPFFFFAIVLAYLTAVIISRFEKLKNLIKR